MKKIYIFIDMQNDFIDMALGTKEAVRIVPYVEKKLKTLISKKLNDNNLELYFTQDTHYENNYFETIEGKHLPIGHCFENQIGWQLCPEFNKLFAKNPWFIPQIIKKETFGYSAWDKILGNVSKDDEIIIMGLCTDICVISNALILKALYPNTKIMVDAKGCAGVSVQSHKNALTQLKMCHIDILNE